MFPIINIITKPSSPSSIIWDKVLINIYTEKLFKNKDTALLENVNKLLKIADTGINSIFFIENKEADYMFPETISP